MKRTFWEELIGSKVCGGYLLRELTANTGNSAVYLTSFGEESVALKLIPEDEAPPEVAPVQHRHLLQLFASGVCDLAGSRFRYFVTEVPDEDLASVIAARPLSPDETREMLGPVLEALAYLHDRGLAHGDVKPSNILAKGDSVKLSLESVRPAGAVASPREDMRALGLTIIEVLTQQRQPSAIGEVPQPFRDIVEHLLQFDPALRWTARQAEIRLSGLVPAAAAPAAAPATGGASARRKEIPAWTYPAAAVAVLVVVLVVLVRVAGSPTGSSLAASGTANASAPASVAPAAAPAPVMPAPATSTTSAVRNKVVAPEHPAPHNESPPQDIPAPASSPAKPTGHGWFVVVASYSREVDAQDEARNLGRGFPEFKPTVFPPSAIDTHYLVIIGSGLSEERAESMRQRAVAAGLPPDSYIKKYPSPRP